jgi:hypothetical protein
MKKYSDDIKENVINPLKNLLLDQVARQKNIEEESLKLSQDLDTEVITAEAAGVEYKKAMEDFENIMDAYTKKENKDGKKLSKKEQVKYVQRVNKALSVRRKAELKYKSMLFAANKTRNEYYEKLVLS